MIERLRDHYIICGYGRVGRAGRPTSSATPGSPFVVLDFNPEVLEIARAAGRARTSRAAARRTRTSTPPASTARAGWSRRSDSDVDNLYICVSARADAARPADRRARLDRGRGAKMRRAGADRVVQPYTAAGPGDGEAVLKPQVAAFLDIVSRARRPRPALRGDRDHGATAPRPGRTIRELRDPARDGALIVALRKADGTFDTTPEPDATLDAGDVLIAVGTAEELQALEELFAPRESRCRLGRSTRLAAALAEARRRAEVALERPGERRARRLRDERRAPARAARSGAAARARARSWPTRPPRCRRSSAPRSPARASSTSGSATRWFGEALGEILDAGTDVRRRAWPSRASASRSRWSRRTRPARSSSRPRGTARTATRSPGCSSSPATRSSASTTTTTPARRWSSSARRSRRSGAGRSRPRTATRATTSRELAQRRRATRCRAMLERIEATLERFRIHFDSWALQSELEQRLPGAAARGSTRTRRTARVWARSSAYGDEQDRVAHPLRDGEPTYRAADIVYLVDKLDARLRPRDLRARRRPPRHAQLVRGGRADARLRPRAGRGAALPARPPDSGAASRRRCRSAAATSSSSTSSWTRSASTRRAGTSSPAAPTRRSRSTSTSPPRSTRRTPSTTSSTPTPGSPGSCATPATRRVGASRAGALAPEERDLVKRLVEFPGVVAEATERRGPHAIPIYAIRVADDFHRFYHHHRVLESDERRRSGSASAARRRR